MLLKRLKMQTPFLLIPFILNIHLQVRGENQGHNFQMDYMQLNWHFSGVFIVIAELPWECVSVQICFISTQTEVELPLNKFVSPPVDPLLAVKQPLSEIQPKITEKFQDGEAGSLHPSLCMALHGIICHQGLQILSAAASALKGAQNETFMSPPTLSQQYFADALSTESKQLHKCPLSQGITPCLNVPPSPRLSLSGHGEMGFTFV